MKDEEIEKENEQPKQQRGCHNCKHDKESPLEICDPCLYGYKDNWELANEYTES